MAVPFYPKYVSKNALDNSHLIKALPGWVHECEQFISALSAVHVGPPLPAASLGLRAVVPVGSQKAEVLLWQVFRR